MAVITLKLLAKSTSVAFMLNCRRMNVGHWKRSIYAFNFLPAREYRRNLFLSLLFHQILKSFKCLIWLNKIPWCLRNFWSTPRIICVAKWMLFIFKIGGSYKVWMGSIVVSLDLLWKFNCLLLLKVYLSHVQNIFPQNSSVFYLFLFYQLLLSLFKLIYKCD